MTASTHVLIVDDDPQIRNLVTEYLGNNGYEVSQAENAESFRAALALRVPDVVLLDVNLGGEDGLSLARYLRANHSVGIIMVTAAGDVVDRVVGLEVGADDYVPKPFDLRELRARIKSVARRAQPNPPSVKPDGADRRIRVGQCSLDLASRQLFDAHGAEIVLTSMEFDLLRVFVENPNKVLTRDHLLNLTRNRDWEPFDRSIDIRIARLRKKVEPDPENPRLIKTVRSAGYMFVPLAV